MKSEWKKIHIRDICQSMSQTYNLGNPKVVLINTSDIYDGKVINHQYVENKNLRGQFKKSFKKGDILYSEIRPQNRRFAFIDFDSRDYIASTKLMVLRSNSKLVLSKYLFQILKSPAIINRLQLLAETRSGTFPQITFSELGDLSIWLPSLSEQHGITVILSCFDDKIELNDKINTNLEVQARTIFKSWFVNFEPFRSGKFIDSELGPIPKGWRVGKLLEIADITMGQSPNGNSYNENNVGTIFFQGRGEFGWRYPTIRLYTTEPKRMAKENDILVSVRAPVGDINVADKACCIGRGLAAIRSKINAQSFILYLLMNEKPMFQNYNGQGTVFGSINKNELFQLPVIIPPTDIVERFEKICSPFDSMIKTKSKESVDLSSARNILLPKLLNGEIEVPMRGI